MDFPKELKYSKEHEWVRVEGNTAIVGITNHAQNQLGDVVFVEIETEGESLEQNEVFGTVEAVKTVSDLYMPIGGKVIAVNEALQDAPETVNSDPYGEGWMIKVEMSSPEELESLMDAVAYEGIL